MKIKITLGLSLLLLGIINTSCLKERIEPDYTIYGDKATVKSVTTFYLKEVTTKLNYDDPVTGYQLQNITNTATTDNANRTIAVKVTNGAGVDLTKMGIRLNTDAQRVEAINGAPTPGLIGDYSKGPYTYRFYSADGTVRDWNLSFSIAP